MKENIPNISARPGFENYLKQEFEVTKIQQESLNLIASLILREQINTAIEVGRSLRRFFEEVC